jgi:putative endonuclease
MRGWLAKLLGNRGENTAVRFLKQKGFRILFRNHKNQFGEIDIIARDQDTIVFVEVKTRSSTAAGHPTEAVTVSKQIQLTKLAMVFLKQHKLLNHRARFDVISIIWAPGSAPPIIEHYVNAFPAMDQRY